MHHIAIFASGTGSNAQKIIEFFQHSIEVRIALVVANRQDAGVLDIARAFDIPVRVVDRAAFSTPSTMLPLLDAHQIDFIVLAGFLWLIPAYLVQAFPRRIVNIHPALLPKYGGKGMFGMHVHEAVRAAKETESGITIHYVNERYDEGDIIFQASCAISPADLPGDIAKKVQLLEHRHFPEVIAQLLIPKHG